MTQRDAAFMGCRLMALWFGIIGAIQLPFVISSRMAMRERLGKEPTGSFAQVFFDNYTLFLPVFHLLFAAALFYGAGRLSRMLSANPEETGALPSRSLLGAGSLLLGIYAAIEYVPSLVSTLYDNLAAGPDKETSLATLVPNLVGIALALGILIWAILQSRKDESTGRGDAQ